MPDAAPVLTRAYESKHGPILFSVCAPAPFPDERLDADPDDPPWRCDYRIEFPDRVTKRYAVGIDAIQSLLLALASAKSDIANGDMTATWLARSHLGLDIPNFF